MQSTITQKANFLWVHTKKIYLYIKAGNGNSTSNCITTRHPFLFNIQKRNIWNSKSHEMHIYSCFPTSVAWDWRSYTITGVYDKNHFISSHRKKMNFYSCNWMDGDYGVEHAWACIEFHLRRVSKQNSHKNRETFQTESASKNIFFLSGIIWNQIVSFHDS